MTVPLTGPESLFVRLGHIFKTIDIINVQRGTTMPPRIDEIEADFDNTDQNITDNIYSNLLSYQNSNSSLPSYFRNISNNILTQMVNDDQPQTSSTSIPVCMNTLISQMETASATVQACVASGNVVPNPSNNGNANVIVSLYGPDGRIQENSFNEIIEGTVISDSQSNGVIVGRESMNFLGQYSIGDTLSWLYPVGSGSNTGLTCIDASQSQQRGNRNNLNNSNFEIWTVPNIPDGWHIGTGTAGTTVKRNAIFFYDGAASLEFDGNGSELTSVYQQFATRLASGDTSASMSPITQFAMNAWVKVDLAPAAGVLQFALVDGSGNVLLDEQGNPSSISADLTTIGTTFVPVYGFLRTPRVLPSGVRFQIKLTTALSTGSSVFIDRLAMALPVQCYQGGPSLAAFSGSNMMVNGDSYTVNIFNNYGGLFQRMFDRIYGMKSMNVLLPSSDTPTIPDSLIS